MHTKKEIQDWLITRIAGLLQIEPAHINIHETLATYGLSSLDAVSLSGELETFLGRRLSPTIVYDHPTILSLAAHLAGETTPAWQPGDGAADGKEPIAIIGMSCRFPGAKDPVSFWKLLSEGLDAITEIPEDRWNPKSFYHPDPAVPGKSVSRWGGFLDNIDQFDPSFFTISPAEAKQMDPQQRLLLELSQEALDDAELVTEELDGSKTGVFIGISVNEYSHLQLENPIGISGHSGTGSALSIAANRISYNYNFHGPSLAIDTACSSSLSAIHLACQSLRNGECGMALAGGVNMILSPAHSIAFTKAGVLAPDGRCKSFDAAANGYVRGEGGGLVVLKPLSRAIADGDPVQGIILGSAMMQDGRTNGLIAPSREAQENLLRQAYRDAGVSPENVQYIEAHGTGTLLGDSIEAGAIGTVLGSARKQGRCLIGAVKSNIGHLESAAGIAGLIKVILSLQHRQVPPTIHFKTPNPHIPFKELRLQVNNELLPWPAEGPFIAGVSSFGFGGTNVHIVIGDGVQAAPEEKVTGNAEERPFLLLPLSAKNEGALKRMAGSFQLLLADGNEVPATDICFGAGRRRSRYDHRLAVTGYSSQDLREGLQAFVLGKSHHGVFSGSHFQQRKIAFVFSGQGGQWPGMASRLLQEEPVFRKTIERIDRSVQARYGWSVIDVLRKEDPDSRLNEIDVVQPAIFAVQVALAELWRSWGIVPAAVAGHSMGEVAAAHIAGILELEEAIHIVCYRSLLLKKLSGQGSMLATDLSAEQAVELLADFDKDVSIGVIGGPSSTVLSGHKETIKKIMAHLESQNLFCRLVNVDVASHSPQMESLRTELLAGLSDLRPLSPLIPVYSTVSGGRGDDLAYDALYWMDNIRKPVLLSAVIDEMLRDGHTDFIEIGPHPVLLGSIQQSLQQAHRHVRLYPSLRREEPESEVLTRTLAQLYVEGFSINWKNFHPWGKRHVLLPMIQWQRQRYWIDKQAPGVHAGWKNTGEHHPLLGERMNLASFPGTYVWQTALDDSTLSFLGDHRVNDDILFPAAGYIEMALQAAKECGMNDPFFIQRFEFLQGMSLQAGKPRTLQCILSPGEKGGFGFSIYSKFTVNESWTLHASCHLVNDPEKAAPPHSTLALHQSIIENGTPIIPEVFYERLRSRGLEYGTDFRVVHNIWSRDAGSLGHIGLSPSQQFEADAYQLHPALLDGCLQVLAAMQGVAPATDIYLPAGCEKIRLFAKPDRTVWSQVSLQPCQETNPDFLIADIRIYDEAGKMIAELSGFRLQRTNRQLRRQSTEQDTWFYRLQWKASDSSCVTNDTATEKKHWLILSDEEGTGRELARQLELRGDSCHLLSFGEAINKMKNVGDEAWKVLLQNTLNEISAPCDGVIHLWSLSIPPPANDFPLDADGIQAHGCNSLLHLVRALSGLMAALPRIWVVTSGAQPVKHDELPAVEQSPILGLGKVISFELTEFKCVRIDLDPQRTAAENISLLIKEMAKDDAEDQIAFRDGLRYVPRLLPYNPASSLNGPAPSFKDESTYLVTGGLGSLGIRTALWMSKKGAKHIVLMGRHEPSDDVTAVIGDMERQGVQVVVEQSDVSDPDQLKKVIGKIEKTMPVLRGIIHAAGLLDDGSLLHLTEERMKKVMAPKMDGTWNLHIASLNLPLDFFVMYSSAVSVLGSPGQGNYAAASTWLDMFAHYRRHLGLPAISINWGPWAEVGLAAEATERLLEQQASTQHLVKVIQIERGLEILEQLLAETAPQVMVLPFDLKNLIELYPAAGGLPFLEEVGGGQTPAARLYARPNLRQPYVAPRNGIEQKLAHMWQQTLHIDKVGVDDSFFELGGDSVLAAQVLALAQKSFDIRINPEKAFSAFTINKLAAMLEQQILARIEEMSEEEVQRLLSNGNE